MSGEGCPLCDVPAAVLSGPPTPNGGGPLWAQDVDCDACGPFRLLTLAIDVPKQKLKARAGIREQLRIEREKHGALRPEITSAMVEYFASGGFPGCFEIRPLPEK